MTMAEAQGPQRDPRGRDRLEMLFAGRQGGLLLLQFLLFLISVFSGPHRGC